MIQKAMIIDLDVHQGNGSAAIFKNDPRVFTLSVHGKNNYPFHKEESDMDIPLPDGIGDQEYIDILQETIPQLLSQVKPEILFYQSGVDILYTDQFGKMNISMKGIYERDRIIMSIEKPIVVAMGGGYSKDIDLIVEAHLGVFQ
jgi:acetoin utilization deacetylase AcuC-like enzyme